MCVKRECAYYKSFWTENGKIARVRVLHEGALYALKYGTFKHLQRNRAPTHSRFSYLTWFNLSFNLATFPKFERALISHLEKPGLSRSDPSNFRSISSLNTIGKILERLALEWLFLHISLSPSFVPLQSANRKCLPKLHYWSWPLTYWILTMVRFQTLQLLTCLLHLTLLTMPLWSIDLSTHLAVWVRDFLDSFIFVRLFSSWIKVDTSSSSQTSLTGVPQGLVLGPLLFVFFISPITSIIQPNSELSNKITTVSLHQHADDIQLHTDTNLSTPVESCIVRVNEWLLQNGLHLNPSKSEAIAFFNSVTSIMFVNCLP